MKMKKIAYGLLAFAPVLALAANPELAPVTSLITQGKSILNSLIPAAFALAILAFFYGLAKFIFSAGDPKNHDSGKNIMIYGILAIAVMASVWGLVTWLQNITGVGQSNTTIVAPTVQF